MARKSGFVRRRGVMRRETAWFSGVSLETTIAAGGGAVLLTSLNAAALALRPFTVIRTRGRIGIRSDQSTTSETQDAAYGMAVVSDEAVAVGITAVPTPDASDGSDLWFVYERLMAQLQLKTAVGFDSAGLVDIQVIDSKAMRKVEPGQDMIEVIESSSFSAGCIIRTYTRSLVKLH